jgi:transposase-like protein
MTPMPIGRPISKELKAQVVAALLTQLDKSIPKIAEQFGLHPWSLYQISKQFNIRRPRGSAALCHRKHKEEAING